MGASESKTDGIDVDVDVADAPVDKTPTPTGSTLSEVDDAKPATPQAVYRTADAPAADTPEEKKSADQAKVIEEARSALDTIDVIASRKKEAGGPEVGE